MKKAPEKPHKAPTIAPAISPPSPPFLLHHTKPLTSLTPIADRLEAAIDAGCAKLIAQYDEKPEEKLIEKRIDDAPKMQSSSPGSHTTPASPSPSSRAS